MTRLGILLCLLAALPGFATVSNLNLPNSAPLQPSDSFWYSYESDRDTTESYIYFETQSPSTGLDTSADHFFIKVIMVDNGTRSEFHDTWAVFPDSDLADSHYLFKPGVADLAAGLYWVLLTDGDNSIVDSFRVARMANPHRTISGTVTPPAGESAAWISLNAYPPCSDNRRFSGLTDSSGRYTILLDSESVAICGGQFRVRLDDGNPFPGYLLSPGERDVNVLSGNATSVDFAFIAASSAVQGRVHYGATGISGVGVGLEDSATGNRVSETGTDASGNFILFCNAGTYRITVSSDNLLPDYMVPEGQHVSVPANDTVTHDINLVAADTVVVGRVTKDGGSPGGRYAVQVRSENLNLWSYAGCDSNGYFSVPATTLDSVFEVGVVDWSGKTYDSLPAGYYYENGQWLHNHHLGDSAFFNMIPRLTGTGSISGTITLAGPPRPGPQHFGVFAIPVDSAALDSGWNPWDHLGGAYPVSLPATGPYTLSGLPDTSFCLLAIAFSDSPEVNRPFAGDTYRDSAGTALVAVRGGAAVIGIDISMDQWGPPQGDGLISGTVTCTGPLAGSPIKVFLGTDFGEPPLAMEMVDSSGQYSFNGIGPGVYLVLAMVDTNNDNNPEAFGYWPDSVRITGADTVRNVNIVLGTMSAKGAGAGLPAAFALGGPSPNPANPAVSLSYAVPVRALVTLTVYDLTGRVVAVIENRVRAPGYYTAVWNGKDARGMGAASGVYICRMAAGDYVMNRKMILMK